MSQTKKQKVAAAVKAIKAFHALGQAVPKQTHKEAYNQGTIEDAAEKHDINPDTVRKARQFASSYTRDELKELCDFISEVQSHQEEDHAVFGRTHVIRLLSVKKPLRFTLQKTAIRKGWSTAELESQIAARYGSRRDGGRRRRVPRDPIELLAQLEGMCESWARWNAAVGAEDATKTPRSSLKALPAKIQRHIQAVDACMTTLHGAVTEQLITQNSERSLRKQFRDEADA